MFQVKKRDDALNFRVLFTLLFERLCRITVNYYRKESALQSVGFPAEWLFILQKFYTNNVGLFDPEPKSSEKKGLMLWRK